MSPEALARREDSLRRLKEALKNIVKEEAIEPWFVTPNDAFESRTPNQVVEDGEIQLLWNMYYRIAMG
jgi:hypothetical protein